MDMGKKLSKGRQWKLWVAAEKQRPSLEHPFCKRLNRVLEKAEFDAFVERLRNIWAGVIGQSNLLTRPYLRMLLLGLLRRGELGTGHHLAGSRF